jgi:hypothetical protein
VPQLVALESSSIDFVNDLESLDRLSPRSADTAHVFYMKSGQKSADEILNNVVSGLNDLFLKNNDDTLAGFDLTSCDPTSKDCAI